MNSLASLSSAQIQAIADFLTGGTTPPPPTTTDGASLYAGNCAACHGATTSSTKIGATVARIDAGIVNVASMNYLSSLSAAQVQAIADYLATLGTPPPGGGTSVPHTDSQEGVGHAIDKDSPFSSGCTACHGSSLQGAIGPSCTSCHGVKWSESGSSGGGTSVPHTDSQEGVGHAIDKDSPYSSGCTACHGSSLQGAAGPSCTSCHSVQWNESAPPSGGSGGTSVSHTDSQEGVGHAIDKDSPYSSGCTACHGTSLQGAAGPSCTSCHSVQWSESAPPSGGSLNGESLYTSYCAACHGPSTNSTKTGAGVTRINNGIASVSSMNSLASLSSAQIQAIANFLTGSTTPPPTTTDGASLYASSCATCHGAGTSSTKAGASVTMIIGGITGISSVASMTSLNTLTVAQVQAISDYLLAMGSSTPPPTTTTGSTLYETSCAACHGSGTNSTKIGATVLRINTGITSVASMNYLSSMSAAEI
jgi:mono/diheme cytochrome c family protein